MFRSRRKPWQPTRQDVIAWILAGNCPDCFHPECLARCDVVDHLRRVLDHEWE